MSNTVKLIIVSLLAGLLPAGWRNSAYATTNDFQAAVQATPSVMHQWSFEGADILTSGVDQVGANDLIEKIDGGTHGGDEPPIHIVYDSPGWDGTSTAASTWHSGGGFNTPTGHGDYFHTGAPIAPPSTFSWEVVLQTGFVPIDGTEAPIEYNLGYVIAHRVSGGPRGYFLWQGTATGPTGDGFSSMTGNWIEGEVTVVEAPLPEDNWYYMAGTYTVNAGDGTSQVDVYAADLTAGDTTLTHTSFANPAAYDYDVEGTFGIGGRMDNSKESFPGVLDEVNLYHEALSGATLQAHLNQLLLSELTTLVWRDALDDDWISGNWTPDGGTTFVAPAGGEAMVVNSGISTISTDLTVIDPAVSLSIARDAAGGTVVIDPAGKLSVGEVSVAIGGRLNVNGTLSTGDLAVDTGGTLGLGAGSVVVSPLAEPDLSDVTLTLEGTVEAGGGVATIGDENNDLSSTNLTLADGANLDWTFGAGDDYIDVNGEVTFAGGLTIQLVDGGGSSAGADVALFRALDSNIVDISQVQVLSPAGLGWTWSTDGGGNPLLTFGGEFLVLEGLVTGVGAVPGDTNGDGIVNDADLANLEAQFGGAPGAESADFDGDGDVDAHDFATMRGNWGFGTGPAPQSGAATPEPATMTVLALGGLLILRRRRRRS